jgi:hypothetical protein
MSIFLSSFSFLFAFPLLAVKIEDMAFSTKLMPSGYNKVGKSVP